MIGGFLSAAVITLTLGYAIIGINDLISRSDPKINQNLVHSYYGTEEIGLDISKTNSRLAIAVTGYDGETKYDNRYMRMTASLYTVNDDGTQNIQKLTLHDCTEEDWT